MNNSLSYYLFKIILHISSYFKILFVAMPFALTLTFHDLNFFAKNVLHHIFIRVVYVSFLALAGRFRAKVSALHLFTFVFVRVEM